MSGSVTVPQKCDISGGMTIPIEFGDIMSNSFKMAGQMPVGFNKVHKELTLKCNNISEGVKVSLSIQGTPDPRFNNALKTEDNEDIAVLFENSAGVVIPVQTGLLPAEMNGLGQLESTGKADVYMYPIKTGDKLPAVGEFNATATVKAEIQ
ncbi:fimbrial protein [Serratia sp. L9]|uniref:fimbrial protein n=1 Tax=Serratia sp. L9 TaxID=3423946 RepID=UPI003D67F85A